MAQMFDAIVLRATCELRLHIIAMMKRCQVAQDY